MPASRLLEDKNFIVKNELLEHVSLSVLRDAKAGLPFLEEWPKGTVRKRPLEIYDINGKLLFCDYTITRGKNVLGTVRANASKIMGNPILSHEIGPRRWNYPAAVKKLTPMVRKKYPRNRITGRKLVCYSYPKLGVMFSMIDAKRRRSKLIYDVASLSLVPEKPARAGYEGISAWSLYDSVSEAKRKTGLREYARSNKLRMSIPTNIRARFKKARALTTVAVAVKWPLFKYSRKLLQFCSHYDYNESRSHHCFILHGQQKNDYCAVATCQMILCYYRYYYTQDEIAPHLNYTPGGGCPADQSAGYEELTCDHLDATYDTSPTWAKAKTEIDGLHPFKTGVPGHARACAGYSSLSLGMFTAQYLYVYDPWPWDADYKLGGAITWENWTSITHTNYITTQLTCP